MLKVIVLIFAFIMPATLAISQENLVEEPAQTDLVLSETEIETMITILRSQQEAQNVLEQRLFGSSDTDEAVSACSKYEYDQCSNNSECCYGLVCKGVGSGVKKYCVKQ